MRQSENIPIDIGMLNGMDGKVGNYGNIVVSITS